MQIVYHLGPPCTDEGELIASLIGNRRALARDGIMVADPKVYRGKLRELIDRLDGAPASQEIQDEFLKRLGAKPETTRIIFSDDTVAAFNRHVFAGPRIWPRIEATVQGLRNLFPGAECEFMIGMRDPSTLVPCLYRGSRSKDYHEFTRKIQLAGVAWSEMLMRLRQAVPSAPVTVWCNEDTPLIWGEILREMAGGDQMRALKGVDDLIEKIMQPEGFTRMQRYLEEKQPENEVQRRRIISAFLDKYVLEDEVEEELEDGPWSEEELDTISQAYEDDMHVVARIPGVTLLTP